MDVTGFVVVVSVRGSIGVHVLVRVLAMIVIVVVIVMIVRVRVLGAVGVIVGVRMFFGMHAG
jgi:hypothetical protein